MLLRHASFERIRIVVRILEEKSSTKIDSKREFLQEVLQFAKAHKDELLEKEIIFLQETIPHQKEESAEYRINLYENLLKDKYAKDPYYKARCLYQIGQNWFVLQEYGLAFEHLGKARKEFERIGFENVPIIGKFLHDLALDYYYFRNYDEAIKLMLISVKLPAWGNHLDIQRFNTLGMCYYKKGLNDSALHYFNLASLQAKKYSNPLWEGLVNGNMGNVYFNKKEYTKALEYLHKEDNVELIEADYHEIAHNSCSNLARVYLQIDSLVKAKYYIDKTEKFFSKQNNYQFGKEQQFEIGKKVYFENQYNYHLKSKDLAGAMLYLDTLRQVEIRESEKYNDNLIKLAEGKLEIQDNLTKLALREKENFRLVLVSFLLFLATVLALLLFYVAKQKNKREKSLFSAKERIAELEKQKIQGELEKSRTEITTFVKKVKEKERLIEDISESLGRLENENLANKVELQKSIKDLKKTKILTPDDWLYFKNNFDSTYPDFTKRISHTFPAITSSELRYLMLVKLGLNHKQMADLPGISSDAIRVTWNRVKKKTDSPAGQTPESLLDQLQCLN